MGVPILCEFAVILMYQYHVWLSSLYTVCWGNLICARAQVAVARKHQRGEQVQAVAVGHRLHPYGDALGTYAPEIAPEIALTGHGLVLTQGPGS